MHDRHAARYRYAGLTGICIASFLGCIDLTVVNTVLPAIGRELSAGLRDTQWITSVFMIALSAFMVPAGTVADKYGRKKLLLIGLTLFGTASAAIGLTSNFVVLTLFRFIQGVGCAVLYTSSGAIISYMFTEQEQGKALGILFAVNGLGLAIGPVVGGFFSGLINWRYAFLMNIPFIVISIYLCLRYLPEQKSSRPQRLDIIGSLLLITFLINVVGLLSIQITAKTTAAILLFTFLSGTLFIVHELRTKHPIVEFHFFKNKRFAAGLTATFLLAFYYCVILLSLPMFVADFAGMTDAETGLLLLPATITFALASAWTGNRSKRHSSEIFIIGGLILFITSGAGLGVAMSGSNIWLFVTPLLLFGAGWGAILGPSTLVALQALPPERAAVAMGTSWTLHNVGGACGIAFAVYVIARHPGSSAGYPMLMYLLSAIAAISAAVCIALLKKRVST